MLANLVAYQTYRKSRIKLGLGKACSPIFGGEPAEKLCVVISLQQLLFLRIFIVDSFAVCVCLTACEFQSLDVEVYSIE